jgi:hypothetical protein
LLRLAYGFCQGDCAAVTTSLIPMPVATAITSFPKMASRSRIKYLGASSHGNASRICCAVHASIGCSVTLQCTTRRRASKDNHGRVHMSLGPGTPAPLYPSPPQTEHRHRLPQGHRVRRQVRARRTASRILAGKKRGMNAYAILADHKRRNWSDDTEGHLLRLSRRHISDVRAPAALGVVARKRDAFDVRFSSPKGVREIDLSWWQG